MNLSVKKLPPPRLAPEAEFDSTEDWIAYIRAARNDAMTRAAWEGAGLGLLLAFASVGLVIGLVKLSHYLFL